jgi:hypothetical protein
MIVVGIFPDVEAAGEAARSLTRSGLAEEALHLRPPGSLHPHRQAPALAVGIGGGSLLGAVAGGVLGYVSTWAVSPLGSVTGEASPLVAIAVFVLMGAAAGGLSGGLFAMDAASDSALYLTQEVEAGRALVSVTVEGEVLGRTEDALRQAGAIEVLELGHGETAERVVHP